MPQGRQWDGKGNAVKLVFLMGEDALLCQAGSQLVVFSYAIMKWWGEAF